MKYALSLLLLCFLISTSVQSQQHASAYKIAHRFHADGDGGWDYLTVNASARRLFVSHGTVVHVIDLPAGKLAGTIADTKGVHGIALAPDLHKGFISNGRDASVTVFDLNSLATVAKITVTGINPDAILYDPFTHRIFTFNGRSANATVIDARTHAVLGTIELAGKPEFAVSDHHGSVFVNIEDKSLVCEIDPSAMKVVHSWPIAPGEEPSGLALDTLSHRLFSVCGNKKMIVLDSRSGRVCATLPIGDGVDGVVFDQTSGMAFSSNGDGTITVVQEADSSTFTVVETFPTQKGARTIALDPFTHHLYLPTAEFGSPAEGNAGGRRQRPSILPGTFTILDIEPVKEP